MSHKVSEVKEWYDGYLFGKTEVYNPWSMINYVRTLISDTDAFPKPYWSNISSNSIIRELIEEADSVAKQEIESLLAGGIIENQFMKILLMKISTKLRIICGIFCFLPGI